MLYHYTDRLSGAEIRAAGVIRAQSMRLYRDIHARDAGYEIEPVVWLSTETAIDATVAAKLIVAGWPEDMTGQIWRFAADPADALTVSQFVDATGMDRMWWEWAVKTGAAAGSHWRTWRLVRRDVPASEWLAVEVRTKNGWQRA